MKHCLLIVWMLLSGILAQAQFTPPVIVDTIGQLRFSSAMFYDWDHDGDLDVMGTTFQDFHLAWQENTGLGQLAPAVQLDTAVYYLYENLPLLVDFNGDNRTDIIYNGYQLDEPLTIKLQLANGSYSPPILTFPHSNELKDFALADCDNDGDMDFVRADQTGLLWYENDGAGNFEPPHFIADPIGGLIHITDVNNDGLSDILVADVPARSIYYFQSLGGGSFKPKTLAASLPELLENLKSADLNGDDLPDLLPVYQEYYSFATFVTGQGWLRNTADGKFAASQPLDQAVNWLHIFREVAAGDLDNDGDVDVLGYMTRDSLLWFENVGSGQFSAQLLAVWPEVQSLKNMILNDFDTDGRLDLLVPSGSTAFFFKNKGGGQFAPRLSIPSSLLQFSNVRLVDINQDNHQDILAASSFDGRLAWYPNLGTGQFGHYQIISNSNFNDYFGNPFMAAGDLDGDGDVDILSGVPKRWNTPYSNSNELVWYQNDGAGHFDERIRVFSPGFYFPVSTAVIADMDGDGKKDIVCLSVTTTQSVAWIRNNGAGSFGFPKFISPAEWTQSFTLTDLDGDADKDVLVVQNNQVDWYRNDGSGNFGSPILVGLQVASYEPLFAEDFDSDGDLDIISGSAWWYPNVGNATFSSAKPLTSDLYPVDIVDLNNDGKPDLLGTDYEAFGWKPNLGGGVLGERIVLNRGFPTRALDVSGDGDKEILYFSEAEIGYFDGIGGLPYISGFCFLDENENGLRDSTEQDLPGIRTTLNTASQLSYTDEKGQFRFYVTPGDYKLTFIQDTCWQLTTDSISYQIAVSDTAVLGKYFGFKPAPGASKLATVASSTPIICGQSADFWLSTSNVGCVPANWKQRFIKHPLIVFESADPAPSTVSGDTLIWESNALQPRETRQIKLTLHIDASLQGTEVPFKTIAESWADDGVTVISRDTFNYGSTVLCSFDPNDKLVNLRELEPGYLPENNVLTYTVRFQNTGTYKAFNIRIRDTLDVGLDWLTLRPAASSHAFFTNLDNEKGIVEFNFPNILLADSTSDESMSHGFVAFTIHPKQALPEGTIIPNRAGIYFDFNPPVITNFAETIVKQTISVHPEKAADDWVSFFPNPASSFVNLQFKKTTDKALVRIYDMQGRLCYEKHLTAVGLSAVFDVSTLPSAAYLLEIIGENGARGRAVLLVQP